MAVHATGFASLQGTLQQRYAAAALQKLNWYYTPQTKRWYKAVNAPPTVDGFGRVCATPPLNLCCKPLSTPKQSDCSCAVAQSIKAYSYIGCLGMPHTRRVNPWMSAGVR